MRQNYKGKKMRREEAKKQKKEAKRLKHLNRKEENLSNSAVVETVPGETRDAVAETPALTSAFEEQSPE